VSFLQTTFALVLAFFMSPIASLAQETKFTIPLTIKLDAEVWSGRTIASRIDQGRVVYSIPGSNDVGQAPGGVLIKFDPDTGLQHQYRVTVDSDGDGDLADETPQAILPEASIHVSVVHTKGDPAIKSLPYIIKYSREQAANGQTRERFNWFPNYRAEGRLKIRNCDALLVLFDLNSDGKFDSEDSSKGTNIGLDRNGDGRIYGADEFITGNQLLEFCGETVLVDKITDATSVSFVTTSLRVPKIGETLPLFSLKTLDGPIIDSRKLRDKTYLLDFWASWCKPCVEKFSFVKKLSEEFKEQLSIIAINVDEAERVPDANRIIKEYKLAWPHVMSGQGESDPTWKMFGTMSTNHLSIPLYVLIDTQGRLVYAGNGGDDLAELRLKIKNLQNQGQ